MSLYDKAKVFFSAAAGAGGEGVAYNIKPEEKLKVDELLTNGGFDSTDGWQILPGYTTVSITDGKLVFTNSAGNTYHRARSTEAVFEIGKTYRVSFEVSDFSRSGGGVKIGALEDDRSSFIQFDKDGKYSTVFTAVGYDHGSGLANTELVFKVFGGVSETVSCKIDNVSVREVEQKANDFSFVRASDLTATYEGPDGLIKKTRENNLTNSNDFSVNGHLGGWYKTQDTPTNHPAVLTSGQSGYDGTTNAWKLEAGDNPDTSDDLEAYIRQPNTNSGVQTFSVYAKAGTVPYMRLIGLGNVVGGSTSNANGWFYLSGSGSVPTTANVIDATIERVGSSDWYRCAITFNRTLVTGVRIQIADGDGADFTNSAKVTEGDNIYIQDAQLEYGLVATPYIDRTDSYSKSTAGIQEDEPRYDYSLDNDAPPVLMLEPERQNYIKHSENLLPSSDWIEGRVDVTANQATSPEGLDNACKVTATVQATANTKRLYSNYWGVSDGETWTVSVFLKADTANKIELRLTSNTEAEIGFGQARFIASGSGTAEWDPNNQGDSVSITQLDNGWYRCTATGTIDSSYAGWTDYARVFVYVMDPGTGARAYVSDGTEALFLYGVQAEKGPYATSYIPTYGSAATRKGEAHNSLASFSCALDNPLSNKYTFILDLRVDNLERPTTSYDDIFTARDASGSEYAFRLEGNVDTSDDPDTYSLRVFAYSTKNSGAALSTPHDSGIQLGQRNKIAIVFDETVGIKVFLNGNSTPLEEVLIGDTFSTDSTKTLQSNSFYEVKTLDGGANPRSKTFLYGVQAYDEALSDAECVSLTTIS